MTENDRLATEILNLADYLIRKTADEKPLTSEEIVKKFQKFIRELNLENYQMVITNSGNTNQ